MSVRVIPAVLVACAFTLAIAVPAFATGGQECRYAARIGIGQAVSGAVSGTTPRCYRFDVEAPGFYQIYTAGQVDTVGSLLDAGFNEIASDDDGGQGLNFLIGRELGRGTYYVVVRGYGSGISGPFTLRVEGSGVDAQAVAGSACENAQPVAPGTPVSCAINGTESTYFCFQVPTAGSYQIATYGSVDTVGALLDAGCNAIEEDDDSGWSYNFYIESSLPAGTYHVAVRGYAEGASGETELIVRPGGSGGGINFQSALDITAPRFVTSMASGTNLKYYRFGISTAGDYRIFSCGGADTVGQLYDANRQMLVEDDDGGPMTNFLLARRLQPGTYYVTVRGYSDSVSGRFALNVVSSADLSRAETVSTGVSVGSSVQGTAPRYFSFSPRSAGAHAVSSSGSVDLLGILFDGSYNPIAFSDDDGGGGNFLISGDLSPETYYLLVRGYDESEAGDFELHVYPAPPTGRSCTDAAPIRLGAPVPGGVRGLERLFYSFQVERRGVYRIRSIGSTDAQGELFDESCYMFASDDDSGHDINFTITHDLRPGTYYLAVSGSNDGVSGPFVLLADSAAAVGGDCATAEQIAVEQQVSGTLMGASPHVYRFNAPVEGPYRIYTRGASDTVGLLLDGQCRALAEDDDGGENANFLIAHNFTPGTYYISVRGYDADSYGEYSLRIQVLGGVDNVSKGLSKEPK